MSFTLFALAVASSFAFASSAAFAETRLELHESDNGRLLRVTKGDYITVTLAEQRSSGETWSPQIDHTDPESWLIYIGTRELPGILEPNPRVILPGHRDPTVLRQFLYRIGNTDGFRGGEKKALRIVYASGSIHQRVFEVQLEVAVPPGPLASSSGV